MKELELMIESYLFYCFYQKKLNEKTLKAYRIDFKQFSLFMTTTNTELNKRNISQYIITLHQQYKPKSAKRKVASLRAFFNYLEFDELIQSNPFSKLRVKFQEPIILPRTLPLSTIKDIFFTAYQNLTKHDLDTPQYRTTLRDISLLELLFATGMRVSEICTLKNTDIDLKEGMVRIYGKGARERIVQISNRDVLRVLKRYQTTFCSKQHHENMFFQGRFKKHLSEQSVRIIIRKYTKMAGIQQHITPHMFRHSFATLLLEEDVDIRYVQHILGHSSITTTQIYTHVSASKQKHILTKKHPRNRIFLQDNK